MKFLDLHSEDIDLIGISMAGLQDMHQYSIDSALYRFLEFPPFTCLEETKQYLKKLINISESKTGHYWFIRHNGDNKYIGTFGVLNIDERRQSVELGYGISPVYWGNGYFNKTIKMVLNYLFRESAVHRVWAKTQWNNFASIKGLEKVGFQQEGELRDFYLSDRGEWNSAVMLSLLATEYK